MEGFFVLTAKVAKENWQKDPKKKKRNSIYLLQSFECSHKINLLSLLR